MTMEMALLNIILGLGLGVLAGIVMVCIVCLLDVVAEPWYRYKYGKSRK